MSTPNPQQTHWKSEPSASRSGAKDADKTAVARVKQYRARRATPWRLRLLRLGFSMLGRFAPRVVGGQAYKMWFSTRRFSEPQREIKWRETARTYTLPHRHGPLMVYEWGVSAAQTPKVLLLHGWNGRATQLGAFVAPLLNAGYQVVSFDAPGHGRTPGHRTNLLQVSDALQTVAVHVGRVQAVVAHSFGAMVLAHALRGGLTVDQAVCVSAPAESLFLIEKFCAALHIPARAKQDLINRINQEFGADIWQRISTVQNAKSLNVPVLLVHDEHDWDVPFTQAEILAEAWRGSQLLRTTGLGHRRILRNKSSVKAVTDYIIHGKQPKFLS